MSFLKLDLNVPVNVRVLSSEWVAGDPGKKEFTVEANGQQLVYSTTSSSVIKKVEDLMGGGVFEQTWWKKPHPKNSGWTYIDVLVQGDISASPQNVEAAKQHAQAKIERNTGYTQQKPTEYVDRSDEIMKSMSFKLAYSKHLSDKLVFDDVPGEARKIYNMLKNIKWEEAPRQVDNQDVSLEDLPF